MDLFLRHYSLAAALLPVWAALALARAGLLPTPFRSKYWLATALTLTVGGFAWLQAPLFVDGGALFSLAFNLLILMALARIVIQRGRTDGIVVSRGVAALGLAPAPELAGVPSAAALRRGWEVAGGVAALSGALLLLGWQLQPCAALDMRLGRSGCFAVIELGADPLAGLRLSPDGGRLLADDRRRALVVADLAGGEPLRISAGGYDIVDMAWSPDGRLIAAATDAPAVALWDAAGGAQLWEAALPAGDYWPSIAWAPAGDRLSADGAVLAAEVRKYVAGGESAVQLFRLPPLP